MIDLLLASLYLGLFYILLTVGWAIWQILDDRAHEKQIRDEAWANRMNEIPVRDATGQIRRVVRPDPDDVRRDVADRMEGRGYRVFVSPSRTLYTTPEELLKSPKVRRDIEATQALFRKIRDQ